MDKNVMRAEDHSCKFDEQNRLSVLRKLQILDTAEEQDFNDLVKLAAMICDAPISLISLLDADRQWFKAKTGINFSETDRSTAFCNYTIRHDGVMVVEDATRDERFKDNPLVTGDTQIRFYAGMALTLNGENIGTLCVKDRVAKSLTEQQLFGFKTLARQVTKQLELRRQNIELKSSYEALERERTRLKESNLDLLASEKEIRSNLKHINELQQHLGVRDRQYRDLVEQATDLIYELDHNGRFTFVNAAMESIFGCSAKELRQRSYWELIDGEDQPRVKEFYKQQRMERRENSYLEFKMNTGVDREIWVGQNVRMFFDDNGKVYKVSAITRDITTLKQTEQKLEKSEQLYRLISLNARDLIGLYTVGEEVKREYVSPSSKDILGYEPEELIGKSPFEVVHPDDVKYIEEMSQSETKKGRPATVEFRCFKKDGTLIWLELNSHPYTDATGKTIGFQTSSRDITKRKEFEESLKEAKERAEEATMAKSKFLSMMSHEIRTPMNAIIGLTNIMLENNPREDQVESLNLLKFSGENLLTIINDILDFNKIEAGKIALESINFDLYALIANIKDMLELRAKEQGIALYFNYATDLPRIVKGDSVRLAQVITNLTGNAIKFTKRGYVEISAALQEATDGERKICVRIKDTGIGIASEKKDVIFERFSQADTDTTRKFGGTGLGLSITKNLVELMGGTIGVESALGYGSTFFFILPLEEGEVPEASNNKNTNPRPVNFQKGTSKVLLVEDNRINQVVAINFLKKWGLQAEIANNGAEALMMVQDKTYDLVLMDLQMPVMDGYEAARKIRNLNDSYFKTIPIIALTASAMMGMKDKVLEEGMNDFVSKPFAPDELRNKIWKHIGAGKSQSAA